jgi:hypothetical protein
MPERLLIALLALLIALVMQVATNQEEVFIYMITVDTSSDWTEVILSGGPRIIS